MTSAIRQIFTFDTAPSNTGGLAGTPSHFRAVTSMPTLNGSCILVLACLANLASNTVTGVSDSVNTALAAYTAVDHLTNHTNGLDTGLYMFPNNGIIQAGDVGTATGGSATTLVDTSKAWTTNQWVGSTFYNLSNGAAGTVTSNTATTLTFATTIASSAGQSYSVGGYVDIQTSNFDDYNAATCIEVTGVTASPLVGHNATQASYAIGTNNVTSGSAACGASPVIKIGFGLNDVDATTPYVPLANTAETDDGARWVFNLGQAIMRVQHINMSNPGTQDAKFSAQSADHFQAFMVALQDVSGGPNVYSLGADMFM